ncbi:hypothetical protein OIU77_023552, partial [Salix suchowensis]
MVSSKCTGIAQDNHDQNTSEAFKYFELRKPQPISGDHEEESDRDEEGASGVHVRGPTFALKRANSSDLNRHRIVSQ